MNRNGILRAVLAPAWVLALTALVVETGQAQVAPLQAKLAGFNEVPSLLSTGTGDFSATIDQSGTSMTFKLTYSGLLADVTQAHIHFGQPGVNGGVMVFFCTNLVPPAGVPAPQACPLRSGTVEGTLTMADVVGPLGQGITPASLGANFNDVISAIRSGNTYANVHSTRWPGGEIRGAVERGLGNRDAGN